MDFADARDVLADAKLRESTAAVALARDMPIDQGFVVTDWPHFPRHWLGEARGSGLYARERMWCRAAGEVGRPTAQSWSASLDGPCRGEVLRG